MHTPPPSRAIPSRILLALGLALLLWGMASTVLASIHAAPHAAIHAQSEEGTLSLAEYQQRLESGLADLSRGRSLAQVQADLDQIHRVRLAQGDLLSVTSPLLGVEDDPLLAQARLRALIAQLDASAQDRADVRLAQLNSLVERLALDRPSLWQRFTRWLGEFLNALLPEELSTGNPILVNTLAEVVGWTAAVVGALALILLLSYWIHRFGAGILAGVRGQTQGEEEGEIPRRAVEARTQANRYAQGGNYREAVRRLYLSALLHLDEQGLIRFERKATNREVLAQLPPDQPIRRHLAPVVHTFDQVWYGIREPDAQTFTHYAAEIDRLMAEKERG
jgi:hypothetical protein